MNVNPWELGDLQSASPGLHALAYALDTLAGESRSLVHVEDHVAQLSLHVNIWKLPRTERHVYHQWILFDDLWASVHPDLANAILRFVRRWDVLSPLDARDEE